MLVVPHLHANAVPAPGAAGLLQHQYPTIPFRMVPSAMQAFSLVPLTKLPAVGTASTPPDDLDLSPCSITWSA